MDPSVIAALRAAVEADPGNVALRLHLGEVLLAADPGAALEQAGAVLALQPSHLGALKLAANAADAIGDPIRAAGYRKLVEALGMQSAQGLIESLPEPPEPREAEPRRMQPLREFEEGEADEDAFGQPETSFEFPTVASDLTLADVAGMEQVKRRLNVAFLGPMRNPDLRQLYKKSLRGGLLLYGPPGCGKTFLAKAIAGELGSRFLTVGFADVVDMYIGESEKNVRRVFETARKNRPCVLFLDEIDALGRKRSLMRQSGGKTTVNQLLAEMDGVDADNEGLFLLAATNHPWDVDSALRRPGRFDRTLLVLPPDAPAREQILRDQLAERPSEGIDARGLAAKTEGFSGADMVHLVDAAAEFAMADSVTTGTIRPIRMADFKEALRDVKPSTRSWFETAKNFAVFSNESGQYDELVEYLRSQKIL